MSRHGCSCNAIGAQVVAKELSCSLKQFPRERSQPSLRRSHRSVRALSKAMKERGTALCCSTLKLALSPASQTSRREDALRALTLMFFSVFNKDQNSGLELILSFVNDITETHS